MCNHKITNHHFNSIFVILNGHLSLVQTMSLQKKGSFTAKNIRLISHIPISIQMSISFLSIRKKPKTDQATEFVFAS